MPQTEGAVLGVWRPHSLISLNGVFLYATPNSKSANILKASLRRSPNANALQLFKSSSVFDALYRRVRYLQTKVSIIQALFKLQ